jgi:hypothetical protein
MTNNTQTPDLTITRAPPALMVATVAILQRLNRLLWVGGHRNFAKDLSRYRCTHPTNISAAHRSALFSLEELPSVKERTHFNVALSPPVPTK